MISTPVASSSQIKSVRVTHPLVCPIKTPTHTILIEIFERAACCVGPAERSGGRARRGGRRRGPWAGSVRAQRPRVGRLRVRECAGRVRRRVRRTHPSVLRGEVNLYFKSVIYRYLYIIIKKMYKKYILKYVKFVIL